MFLKVPMKLDAIMANGAQEVPVVKIPEKQISSETSKQNKPNLTYFGFCCAFLSVTTSNNEQ